MGDSACIIHKLLLDVDLNIKLILTDPVCDTFVSWDEACIPLQNSIVQNKCEKL